MGTVVEMCLVMLRRRLLGWMDAMLLHHPSSATLNNIRSTSSSLNALDEPKSGHSLCTADRYINQSW